MRKLLIFIFLISPLYYCYGQSDFLSNWQSMWDGIKESIADGSFDPSKYGLSGLGGIFDNDYSGFLGERGLVSLGDTWDILHIGRIHSDITKRQEKIMAKQDSINQNV